MPPSRRRGSEPLVPPSARSLSRRTPLILFLGHFLPVVQVLAALPPGYEDELYCPPGFCMLDKKMPAGFCGPRTAFWECYHKETGERRKVVAWGSNHGEVGWFVWESNHGKPVGWFVCWGSIQGIESSSRTCYFFFPFFSGVVAPGGDRVSSKLK